MNANKVRRGLKNIQIERIDKEKELDLPFCASGRSAHSVEDSVSNSGAAMSECLKLQQLSLERSLFLISNDPVGRNFLFNNQ